MKGEVKMKKVLKSVSILVSLLMVLTMFSGCGTGKKASTGEMGKSGFPVTITDVYGSQITIDKKPEKIVVLAPSTVEVLYKLGLQDSIVGVTDYCDYPAEAKSKPKIGDFNGVNIEKIVEAKPDIVLAGAGMSKEQYQQLTDLKLKVVVTEARTLAQIPETFMMIGKATGTEDKAKALADDLTKKINDIKNKLKDAPKVKAYYVVSFGKDNWTAGKGTFISDLINIAGGENISDDVESWNNYSIEKLVEKDPAVLLISGMVANGSKNILDNEKGYKDTSAVKKGNVYILDDNLTQRPGPRIIEGLELIAKALHPDLMGK
jgi:ABC-type Fe3+-hydroxamate transport system, periplasmic component